MEEHIRRLVWNAKHLLDFKTYNPWRLAGGGDLRPKKLLAWQDFLHSAKNIVVEAGRVYLGLGAEKAKADAEKKHHYE